MIPNLKTIGTHRLMAIHIVLLVVAVLMDTVYASVMIVIGSVALLLIPVSTGLISIFASFIAGMICSNITVRTSCCIYELVVV